MTSKKELREMCEKYAGRADAAREAHLKANSALALKATSLERVAAEKAKLAGENARLEYEAELNAELIEAGSKARRALETMARRHRLLDTYTDEHGVFIVGDLISDLEVWDRRRLDNEAFARLEGVSFE